VCVAGNKCQGQLRRNVWTFAQDVGVS